MIIAIDGKKKRTYGKIQYHFMTPPKKNQQSRNKKEISSNWTSI